MIDPRREYLAMMRRMPLSAAQELHSLHRIPWSAITRVLPVPTRIRFTDKAQSLFEPCEEGKAAWLIPATSANPRAPEEIEAVNPLCVVAKGPIVDLVAFHPDRRNRFALRLGNAVTLGCIEPQYLAPDRVPVWADITDWLRSGCSGIVLLTDDPWQCGRILRRIESIDAQDPARVKAWLDHPAPRPPVVFAMAA